MTTKTTESMVAQSNDQPSPMADPLGLIFRALIKLHSIWVSLTYPFAFRGRNLWIHYTCELSRLTAHRIKLGDSVVIMRDALVNVVAPPEQKGEPIVVIDENVGVGPCCQISAKNRVHLERDTIIAQSALICDHSSVFEDRRLPDSEQASKGGRIRIGQGCWIGRGAAIVCTHGELVLGRNCVVGANALVTRSFPPYSVIIGNPSVVIRRFDPVKHAWVIGSARSTGTPDSSE